MPNIKPLNECPETFWAWFAGFIDGDGSINWVTQQHANHPNAIVQCGQKGREILDFIVDSLGSGSLSSADDNRDYWTLKFGSAASRTICARVLPYLKHPNRRQRAVELLQWRRREPGEWVTSPEKNDKHATVIELYKAGLSTSEICAQTGIPAKTIWRWAVRAGIGRTMREIAEARGKLMRGKAKTTKYFPLRARAIAMRANGMSGPAIAKELGVSVGIVYYWLKVAKE